MNVRDKRLLSALELVARARRRRQLTIQRFAVLNAAAQELRPRGNAWLRISLLRQQAPESWMVPSQLVAEAVAVLPYARSKPPDILYKSVTIEIGEVFVHVANITIPLEDRQ